MDQQLDQYQEKIKATWQKVKSSVLVGLPARHQRVLSVILLLIAVAVIVSATYQVKFFWEMVRFAYDGSIDAGGDAFVLVFALFQLFLPVITVIGIVQMLASKTWGWVFVMSFILTAMIWQIGMIVSYFRIEEVVQDQSILGLIDSVLRPSLGMTIFWLMAYLVYLGYFLSKPIKDHYRIGRIQVLWSAGIALVILIIESMISLIDM